MKYMINGRNVDITSNLKDAVYKKFGRIEKFFDEETLAVVTMRLEGARHIVEVTIRIPNGVIRTEQSTDDMYLSIDRAADVIERQVHKYKGKLQTKYHSAKPVVIPVQEEADDEIRIVRSKKIAIKPMDPREACIQMDLVGHDFFAFINAETGEINVVYKRKAGDYGLIEPDK